MKLPRSQYTVFVFSILLLFTSACAFSPLNGNNADEIESPQGDSELALEGEATADSSESTILDDKLEFVMVQQALCSWDDYWCPVEDGIHDAGRFFDIRISILGPYEYDAIATSALIDHAALGRPDGLGITLIDAALFSAPMDRAISAGIPIVAYNEGGGPLADQIPYLSYLGQDEFEAGYLAGLKLLNAGGTDAVCINHRVGLPSLDARCNGLIQAFLEQEYSARVLQVNEDAASAEVDITNFLARNPTIDTVMTAGESSATPYYAYRLATTDAQRALIHGTFGLTEDIEAKIMSGETLFGVGDQPYLQGFGAVYWLMMLNRYGIEPALPVIATGPGIVDATILESRDPSAPIEIIAIQHARCEWDAFWCVVEKGIETAAAELGVNVSIWGPDSFDISETAALIDRAVAFEPDAIMVTVTDPLIFSAPIRRAIAAGIPVIAYNTGNGAVIDRIPYLTYMGQDEFQAGYQGGLKLIAAGATHGGCVNHQVGSVNLDERCVGFQAAFAENGLNADIIEINDDADDSTRILQQTFADMPSIDAVFTNGPNGANPYYAWLQLPDSIAKLHGSVDLSPEIVAAIRDGRTLFSIDQQPFLQGHGSVTALTLLLRHGVVPASQITATGPGFVDRSNVDLVEELAGTFR